MDRAGPPRAPILALASEFGRSSAPVVSRPFRTRRAEPNPPRGPDALFDELPSLLCFARVVEARSFSAAARALGVSKSVVSSRVSRLEERLQERLLVRTTRRTAVTDSGLAVYARAARMLEEAGAAVRGGSDVSRGHIRVNAPVSLAQMYLAEPLARYLAATPGVHVELTLSDRLVDLVEERVDVALRVAKLRDSTLVARRLASSSIHVCASPAYLARRGTPSSPEDLLQHDCLRYTHLRREDEWRFYGREGRIAVPVSGPLSVGDGSLLREAAVAGAGLAPERETESSDVADLEEEIASPAELQEELLAGLEHGCSCCARARGRSARRMGTRAMRLRLVVIARLWHNSTQFGSLTMRKPLTPADLPEDLARFAEARIAAGLSADAEDALRAGKAALEAEQRRRDAKLAKLRAAIDEGDASGVAEDSSLDGILRDIRAQRGRSPAIP
ncbi:MAG: LysR family transcriptional regulator [Myxococcales bacterium]|nr:LysR family transcriptional regulator [Myxococcales bacterium]